MQNKIIKMSDFLTQMEEGPVAFLILDAQYDTIDTVKGASEVLRLELELTKPDEPKSKSTLKYQLFVGYKQRSLFHHFFTAATLVLGGKPFTTENLIGMIGKADLTYYKKDEQSFAYERFYNWEFFIPPKVADETLKQHFGNAELDFSASDEDIDF